MGVERNWTKEEVEYMEESWGKSPIPKIAEKLNRSVTAIKLKAYKTGLRRHIHSGDFITLNQLCRALKINYGYTGNMWIERGLPVKKKKSLNMKYRIIYIKDFWPWAERNKMLVDFSKVEKYILGPEPEWVYEKRKADIMAKKYKKTPWEPQDDERLISLLNSFCYTYRDISIKLERTEGAIVRRMGDLGLKQRPVKANNHNPWSPEDESILIDMYYKGYIAEIIAEEIPRSAKAIKGKIERMVREGSLDPNRYRQGIGERLIDNMFVSDKKREFVMSRSEKERATMRRFATHLLATVRKGSKSPDSEAIGSFISTWRDLNLMEG